MVRLRGVAHLAVVASLCFRRGAAQYDSCTFGTVADIGNGRCDAVNNVPSCGFDGGDCCACTCVDGPLHSCSDSTFDCVYPACDEPIPAPDDSTCDEEQAEDGWCDEVNDNPTCGYDGGDCCVESGFSDGRCDERSNNDVCGYDGGDVS